MNLTDTCLVNKGHERDSIVVCKDSKAESQSEYRLINKKGDIISKYEVDGCLINENNIEKCDFLLTVCNEEEKLLAVFVELKGKKFSKAISQVNKTIDKLQPSSKQYRVFARIVMSAVPKVQGPTYTKLLEKTAVLGGNLKIRSKVLSEKTTELLQE